MSSTYVAVDEESLAHAMARAVGSDRIVTAWPEGAARPWLGFSPAVGNWYVASWSVAHPCGAWTLGPDGKPRCRTPGKA